MITLRRSAGAFLSRAQKTFYRQVGREPVGPVRRWLLNCFGRIALQACAVGDEAEQSYVLSGRSSSTIVPPCLVGMQPNIASGMFPHLRAHIIRDATVSAYASGVLCGERLLLSDEIISSRPRTRTDGSGLFWWGRSHAVGRSIRPKRAATGILIGGAGAFNWYHFIIECLPKAALANRLPEKYKDFPLLVPAECQSIPSFARALAIFAADRPIVYLHKREYLEVGQLVTFDDVSIGPFNLHRGLWPEVGDYSNHDDMMREYLRELRSELLRDCTLPKHSGHRIFLTRPGTKRDYNQNELIEIARHYGFEPHAPESLSLPDQARLFAEAEMVAGASGAAWVGMAFCTRPNKFLSWLVPEYSEFCSYSSLAGLLGHRMRYLEAAPSCTLRSTDDAYTKGYWINPNQFENALRKMIGPSQNDTLP